MWIAVTKPANNLSFSQIIRDGMPGKRRMVYRKSLVRCRPNPLNDPSEFEQISLIMGRMGSGGSTRDGGVGGGRRGLQIY